MEIMDAITARRSIRRFLDKPVPREVLDRLIEAARWAPSAGNRQDWHFNVVVSSDMKTRLSEAVEQKWACLSKDKESGVMDDLKSYSGHFLWFHRAPAVIVVSCRAPTTFLTETLGPESARRTAGAAVSAAMAAQNILLAAESFGLGGCCLTGPLAAEVELKHLLGLGLQREIVCLIALGYPNETPSKPGRKHINDIARYWT